MTRRRKRRETDRENHRGGWNSSQKVSLKEHKSSSTDTIPTARQRFFRQCGHIKSSPSSKPGGKNNLLTHFLKDLNCEICRETKNTRAPCKRNPETKRTDHNERQSLGASLQLTTKMFTKRTSLAFNIDNQWSFKIWENKECQRNHVKLTPVHLQESCRSKAKASCAKKVANLDVLQQKSIDDHCSVDEDRL